MLALHFIVKNSSNGILQQSSLNSLSSRFLKEEKFEGLVELEVDVEEEQVKQIGTSSSGSSSFEIS